MRVVVVGGGPAGLYCAYLLKRRRPYADVSVLEQNALDATFGFGVVFSDRALEFLAADDAETLAAIRPHLQIWQDITVVHRGERIIIDGVAFAAVGRLTLLRVLQERLQSVGIVPKYQHTVRGVDELDPSDLVVVADGANSFVRTAHAEMFGSSTSLGSNRFAWYGTRRRFDTLTQTFRRTELGYFNAHHYPYGPDMSTFIVEVDERTFAGTGLQAMSETEGRAICERVFAEELCGEPLISNRSIWRQFPTVRNRRWSHGKCVLVGDALRTAHFSIGSGTRLAMEDAIALDRALAANGDDIPTALQAYETTRRPIVDKLQQAADASAAWYDRFPQHMELDPLPFAMSYITRSGRLDPIRLRQASPLFAAQYDRHVG